MTDPKPPSRTEITKRKLNLARGLLERRIPISDVKRALVQEFSCSERSAQRFITKAYELLRLDSEKPREDHLSDSYAFYLGIIRDASNSTRDRLRAQERIDKLLGLEAPLKLCATDQSGTDLNQPSFTPAEIRAQLAQALEKVLTHAALPT